MDRDWKMKALVTWCIGFVLGGAAVSGCCFGGGASTATTDPSAPLAVAPSLPLAPPAPAGAVALSVGPGLTPDPTTTSGLAGGPVQASTLSPNCYAGSFPVTPQVTVRVTAALPMAAIIAQSDTDLTLAVRRPDGTFACDDDGDEGVNPRVAEALVPGDYAVYVGTFGGGNAPFTLGVTTAPALSAGLLSGTILRHGHLRVLTSSGTAGPMPGTICDYVQVGIPPEPSGLDVRWRVVCTDTAFYGDTAGYSYRTRPEWPAGTLISDAQTTAQDSDPSFVWDGTGIRLRDDSSNWHGDYDMTLAEAP
jgi:hypothetical protein